MKSFKIVLACLSAILAGGLLAVAYKRTFPPAAKAARTPSQLSIAIGRIHGAPEYIEHRLREAVFNELEERGVAPEATKGAFLVEGTILSEFDAASQTTTVKVLWEIRAPSGRRLGTVAQSNSCFPNVDHEACKTALMFDLAHRGGMGAAIGILQSVKGE